MIWKATSLISTILAIGALIICFQLERELKLTVEAHNSLSGFVHTLHPNKSWTYIRKDLLK